MEKVTFKILIEKSSQNRAKIDTFKTHIYDHLLFCLGQHFSKQKGADLYHFMDTNLSS